MVLKYFTDGDFRFHSYILKEKVRQCKEKVQTLTESHDLHQSGVATFFTEIRVLFRFIAVLICGINPRYRKLYKNTKN